MKNSGSFIKLIFPINILCIAYIVTFEREREREREREKEYIIIIFSFVDSFNFRRALMLDVVSI